MQQSPLHRLMFFCQAGQHSYRGRGPWPFGFRLFSESGLCYRVATGTSHMGTPPECTPEKSGVHSFSTHMGIRGLPPLVCGCFTHSRGCLGDLINWILWWFFILQFKSNSNRITEIKTLFLNAFLYSSNCISRKTISAMLLLNSIMPVKGLTLCL